MPAQQPEQKGGGSGVQITSANQRAMLRPAPSKVLQEHHGFVTAAHIWGVTSEILRRLLEHRRHDGRLFLVRGRNPFVLGATQMLCAPQR